jgi:hypothetical protein
MVVEAKSLGMTTNETAGSGKRKRSASESSEDSSAESSEWDSCSPKPYQTISRSGKRRIDPGTDEEDRLCDEEFETLLRDGCFGSSIPCCEQPRQEDALNCAASSVQSSAAQASQETVELT